MVDLIAHKHRPSCIDDFKFNIEQASRLKKWIWDFINPSDTHSDTDDSSDSAEPLVTPQCILLTGPTGVGKTSLVYAIANELKLHVVETHSADCRDAKLFNKLKLTNQKGKINAFAKMFQAAQKKRRKLTTPQLPHPEPLSLCGDSSVVLFDDIDVVFEEDGPFLRSLADFIGESKRPVVLTATQSIDYIKESLRVPYEHIDLTRPHLEDCARLLNCICRKEKLTKLSKSLTKCQKVASLSDCDIRQCLNRIHFYGDDADQNLGVEPIHTSLGRLNLIEPDKEQPALECFVNRSLVDLMEAKFLEEPCFNHLLGQQIKKSIVELTHKLHPAEEKEKISYCRDNDEIKSEVDIINEIKVALKSKRRLESLRPRALRVL